MKRQKDQQMTKPSISSNRSSAHSSSVYHQIRLQMSKFFDAQHQKNISKSKATKYNGHKHKNHSSRNNSPVLQNQVHQQEEFYQKHKQKYQHDTLPRKKKVIISHTNPIYSKKMLNNYLHVPNSPSSLQLYSDQSGINNYPFSLQNSVLMPDKKYQKQQLSSMRVNYSNNNTPKNEKKIGQIVKGSIPHSTSYGKMRKYIEKRFFIYNYIIGKGGFGKVWKVQYVHNRKHYAMKQMLKSIVLSKKSLQSIINEQKILSKLRSSFLVNINYAFQDRETLYLALDLMEGGDMRYHLNCQNFNEYQAKFFISCLILGLEYIHSNGIIHRDIKPENLVLDQRGYLRITDFGIARYHRTNNSSDTSGTPGYMSPQVICRQNHTFISDYFAVGVFAHELMLGKRPYNGGSRAEIREQILAKQASVKPQQLPENWSFDAIDFINRLLMRKQQQRLGVKGIQQIKQHPWLSSINWNKLKRKQISSPFIPIMRKSDFDQDEQITVQDEEEAELIQKNALLLRKQQFQDLFKQYYYSVDQVYNSQNQQINKYSKQQQFKQKYESIQSKLQKKYPKTNKNEHIYNHNYHQGVQTAKGSRQRPITSLTSNHHFALQNSSKHQFVNQSSQAMRSGSFTNMSSSHFANNPVSTNHSFQNKRNWTGTPNYIQKANNMGNNSHYVNSGPIFVNSSLTYSGSNSNSTKNRRQNIETQNNYIHKY